MEFQSIASSSKGNAYYIGTKDDALLVDCGVSMRRIEAALGPRIHKVRAVVLTHEHRDHIAGLAPFLRRYAVPVYGSVATLEAAAQKLSLPRERLTPWQDTQTTLFGMTIESFALSHDAAAPLGYRFSHNNISIGFATDTGVVTNTIASMLYDANALILEANHHLGMLAQGPYPPHLKARVASDKGHLSNDACADTLREVVTERTSHILLAHLSEENNHPHRALETVRNTLRRLPLHGKVLLGVAAPNHHGPHVVLRDE